MIGVGRDVHLEAGSSFIARLDDRLGHGLPDLLVGLEHALRHDDEIADVRRAAEALVHLLGPAGVDIPAGVRGVGKRVEAEAHDGHGGLAAWGGDAAAVALMARDHRDARNGQIHRVRAADMPVKRDAQRRRARLQNGCGDGRRRVAAELCLRVRDNIEHRAVDQPLVGRVQPLQRRGDDLVDVPHRAQNALAAEAFAAVEVKMDLMRADGNAGRAHRSARRAVFRRDHGLYAGVAAVRVYLSCRNGADLCSCHFSVTPSVSIYKFIPGSKSRADQARRRLPQPLRRSRAARAAPTCRACAVRPPDRSRPASQPAPFRRL